METPAERGFVLGTAGHIDHGKSSLVQALTGTDPDRLPEEKARGLTIDLGFAELILPSGRHISIVDVPGHERFVATMVSGASGIDAAMLVVAADEGLMPQTREHVAILRLLNVPLFVVISKADLVDETMIDLITMEMLDELGPETQFIRVSARTGAGLPGLLSAIEARAQNPRVLEPGLPRLPIDRVFTMKGFGTVITGTLSGAPIETGMELLAAPDGPLSRVRSLQVHGRTVPLAGPGHRVGVNLAGVEHDRLHRGQVLGPRSAVRPVRRFDAHLQLLAMAKLTIGPSLQATILAGSDEAQGRIAPLAEPIQPGESGWARVTLDRPMVIWRGQRLIVRLPSPLGTVGGGQVALLSPRRGSIADGDLPNLLAPDPEIILAALACMRPRLPDALLTLANLPADAGHAALGRLLDSKRLIRIGERVVGPDGYETLAAHMTALLAEYHQRYPRRPSMPAEEIRSHLHLSRSELIDLATTMAANGRLTIAGTSVESLALPGHNVELEDDVNAKLIADLHAGGFAPPAMTELISRHSADAERIRALLTAGTIIRLTDDIYFAADTYQQATQLILDLIERDGPVTVSQARDALNSSRKYVLAILERMDGEGLTRRNGDLRSLGLKAHARSR